MCFAPQWRALFRQLDDIWTSKSVPSMWCSEYVHFQTCFAPQRRALFGHLNIQLPNVVREWCVLYILTSTCASRRNGVSFFISHLPRCLRTRRFSEPPFRPSGATNHWKNYLFAHLHLLSSDFLHLLSSPFWLSPRPSFFLALLLTGCAFHLSIL